MMERRIFFILIMTLLACVDALPCILAFGKVDNHPELTVREPFSCLFLKFSNYLFCRFNIGLINFNKLSPRSKELNGLARFLTSGFLQ